MLLTGSDALNWYGTLPPVPCASFAVHTQVERLQHVEVTSIHSRTLPSTNDLEEQACEQVMRGRSSAAPVNGLARQAAAAWGMTSFYGGLRFFETEAVAHMCQSHQHSAAKRALAPKSTGWTNVEP